MSQAEGLTSQQLARIDELSAAALGLPHRERRSYVEEHCTDDPVVLSTTRASCRCTSWASTPEGRVYFTMKLVKGTTLKEVFDELVAKGGGLDADARTRCACSRSARPWPTPTPRA